MSHDLQNGTGIRSGDCMVYLIPLPITGHNHNYTDEHRSSLNRRILLQVCSG